jgi:Topoisomerase IA
MRVTFNEITKGAVTSALKSPRAIDVPMVEAHLARRAMDRLLGFGVSPFLWNTVARGLSAGRVQTPALRMVSERDREVEAEGVRMRIDGKVEIGGMGDAGVFTLVGDTVEVAEGEGGGPWEAICREIGGLRKDTEWIVVSCGEKETRRGAPAPFQTSTALRAGAAMGISAKRMTGVLQAL